MTAVLRGLYVILDPEIAPDRDLLDVAGAAIAGGARLLQLRAKRMDKGDALPVARAIADLAREQGVPLVIDDHADLALACGAAGVHVGQRDLPVAFVRSLLGPAAIVGCSAATPAEAQAAERAGASYLGTGAVYPTSSKAQTRPTGLDGLRRVCQATALPVFGIGGIDASNVAAVIEAGAAGAAVIGAISRASDVAAAARAIVTAIDRAAGAANRVDA